MGHRRTSLLRASAAAFAVLAVAGGAAACSSDEPVTRRPNASGTATDSASPTPDPAPAPTATATGTAPDESGEGAPPTVGPTGPATPGTAGPTGSVTPGTVASTGPAAPGTILPPVPLDRPADAGQGVTVSLVRTVSVETQGVGPGESAGEPAVAVTLRVQNDSAQPLDLGSTVVSLATGPEATPGRFSQGPPARAFSGSVAAGASAEGVYVFALPPGERGDVVLDVSLVPERPVVRLTGSLA